LFGIPNYIIHAYYNEGNLMNISSSLQDYLKFIYEISQQKKYARIKDIARLKKVSMPSATEAMRKLSKLGLIQYHAYEFIQLTEKGENLAHYMFSLQNFLVKFLKEILSIDKEKAESEACKLEHCLESETLERLVLLYQYIISCPKTDKSFIKGFKECIASTVIGSKVSDFCKDCFVKTKFPHYIKNGKLKHILLKDMKPGEHGNIIMIGPDFNIRKKILKKGIFPANKVEMVHVDNKKDLFCINIEGYQTSISKVEATNIEVEIEKET